MTIIIILFVLVIIRILIQISVIMTLDYLENFNTGSYLKIKRVYTRVVGIESKFWSSILKLFFRNKKNKGKKKKENKG